MSQNEGSAKSDHPLILCVLGIHDWKFKESHTHGGVAELGRYIFLPNTETIFECACRKQKSVITNFRGDVIG